MTGQVDVEFDDGETFYHVIEPGEQTIYNLTMNNSTPGPKDLVADTYGLNITGVPTNWTATLFFADNHTAIFPDSITKRGAKHLGELRKIVSEGNRAIIFYLTQRTDVSEWDLACDIDKNYCNAFKEASDSGVEVMAYKSSITIEGIKLGEELFRRKV